MILNNKTWYILDTCWYFVFNLDSYSSVVMLPSTLNYFLPYYHHSKLAKQRITLSEASLEASLYHRKHTHRTVIFYIYKTQEVCPAIWICCYIAHTEISKKLTNKQDFTSAVQKMASTKLH